jgi:serine/threonine/tyrosine-interacting protein
MTNAPPPQYTPTQPYFAAPSRPHLSLPPLSFMDSETSSVDLHSVHAFPPGEFASAEFLKSTGKEFFVLNTKAPDWMYQMRRQAQMILPFLYLGPSSAIKDREFLKAEGITLLLAIRSQQSAQAQLVAGSKVAAELGIAAETIDVADLQGLIAEFPKAIRLINDHICPASSDRAGATPPQNDYKDGNGNIKKKVLVFCESGNERSACVVIAYLMTMLNLSMVSGTHAVQSRRFCIAIDEPMRYALSSFHSILQAKRDVAKASTPKTQVFGERLTVPTDSKLMRKRSIDELEPIDSQMGTSMDMTPVNRGDMDAERFFHRDSSAPFQDIR